MLEFLTALFMVTQPVTVQSPTTFQIAGVAVVLTEPEHPVNHFKEFPIWN